MELRNPQIIKISIIIVAIILLIIIVAKRFFKDRYSKGTKIANTHFLKSDKYYKYLKNMLMIMRVVASCCGIASILISIYLLARPFKIEIIEEKEYNRDIMLCMDVSGSVWNLNIETIKSLKEIIASLKGDRFGVNIFDGTSVSIVPLTDDYDYINDRLENLSKVISIFSNNSQYALSEDQQKDYELVEMYNLIVQTHVYSQNAHEGSSLIGDGLASCVFSFSRLDEERSRVIILSTDNQVQGTPIVTLDTAADIAKGKNIKVFGLGTKLLATNYMNAKTDFIEAVNKTGGKLFVQGQDSIDDAITEIDNVSKSVNTTVIQKDYDLPKTPFIYLLITTSLYIILSKKVQE